MDMKESDGVGAFAPVAGGWEVKSSEPFGLGLGRMVIIEERLDMVGSAWGCPRMTVVLYSDWMLEVLSRSGRALPSL